jgi:hypothetical protein
MTRLVFVIFFLNLSLKLSCVIPRMEFWANAHGVTKTPGTRFMIYSAATVTFGSPTSFCLKEVNIERHKD